jgi:3-hydroxyacyl-CoA dehydrogenase
MADPISTERHGDVLVILSNSPPVNALGHAVRTGLDKAVKAAVDDDHIKAIVIQCAGQTFFAGADISEFGKPFASPTLPELIDRIEAVDKPVVAAIHGTALGGGCEVALGCHYRLASSTARIGLPEVKLGLIPGAAGTQRLPRLVGAAAALPMVAIGKPISAKAAMEIGLVDQLSDNESLAAAAIAFARSKIGQPIPRASEKTANQDGVNDPSIFDSFLAQNQRQFRGFEAPKAAVEAVRAAGGANYLEGVQREGELFQALMEGIQSAAMRHYFFAERAAGKVEGLAKDVPVRPIERVGVLGAGTMGGGIAMNFLNVGIPVLLVEVGQEALDRGVSTIRRNYEASAKKGRLTTEQVEQRMSLLDPTLAFERLADRDLVIEAVFESLEIKKEIFRQLDGVVKSGAILASNTSFLDLDEIAAETNRPDDVVGLHFFSPANVMPLLEVVRGTATAPDIVATAMKLARKIGKIAVLAGTGYGFIANRAMEPRMVQAEALVLDGATPAQVDKILVDFGFPMGAFQMIDIVGLDVIGRDSDKRSLMSELVAIGRLGQKRNGGFYNYDQHRRPSPSPEADSVIERFRGGLAIEPRDVPDEEVRDRLLYSIVNECARILDDGIAQRASDIDVALIAGYNWPVQTGGPTFWADTVGLGEIVSRLRSLSREHGAAFEPSPLLERLAASGGVLHQARRA